MPNIIANKNYNRLEPESPSTQSDGYWDCSKRDQAVEYAESVYNNAVENYEKVNEFSGDVQEEVEKVTEVIQLYDDIYSLISNTAESFLTNSNVSSLNVGLSCLNNYKSVLYDIISQAKLSSNKCFDNIVEAKEALDQAKKIECEWVVNP